MDEPIRTLERDPQASSKGMGRGGGADGAGLALKVVNFSMNERPPSGQVLGYRTQRGASLFDSAHHVLIVSIPHRILLTRWGAKWIYESRPELRGLRTGLLFPRFLSAPFARLGWNTTNIRRLGEG